MYFYHLCYKISLQNALKFFFLLLLFEEEFYILREKQKKANCKEADNFVKSVKIVSACLVYST